MIENIFIPTNEYIYREVVRMLGIKRANNSKDLILTSCLLPNFEVAIINCLILFNNIYSNQ